MKLFLSLLCALGCLSARAQLSITGSAAFQGAAAFRAAAAGGGGGNSWVRGVTNAISAVGPTANIPHTNTAGRFDLVMIGYRNDTSGAIT